MTHEPTATLVQRPPVGPVEPADPATGEDSRPVEGTARRRSARVLAIAGGILMGVLAAGLLVWSIRPHLYSGTVLQGDDPAPSLQGLVDIAGNTPDPAAIGGVTLLYFGYTGCPDVCPTTLLMADQALDRLSAADRDRVQTMMVTVDPDRDSIETVDAYVKAFDPTFAGLWGSPVAVADVASRYGVYFATQPPDDTGWYAVDHTATVLGIDTGGSLRIVWPPNVTSDQLAADIEALLD